MRRASLAMLVVLCSATFAHAAISTGDIVKFVSQTSGQSAGYGGSFDWVDQTAGGSPFTTFCAEMGSGPSSWIVYGATYQIASFIFPTVDQPINDASPTAATLLDLQGVFLLDQWMSGSILKNSTNAAAVQTQLWLSEGYTETEISGEGGINNLSAIEGTIATLLTSLGYTGSWIPGDNVAVLEAYGDNGYQSNGSPAQDQYVYIGGAGPSDLAPVPEPASFVIWSLIAGWSWLGMRVWRRRGAGLVVDREARQPWSPEDRRAIRALVARRGSR